MGRRLRQRRFDYAQRDATPWDSGENAAGIRRRRRRPIRAYSCGFVVEKQLSWFFLSLLSSMNLAVDVLSLSLFS